MTKKSVLLSILAAVVLVTGSTLLNSHIDHSLYDDTIYAFSFSVFAVSLIGAQYGSVSLVSALDNEYLYCDVRFLQYAEEDLKNSNYTFYHQSILNECIDCYKAHQKYKKLIFSLSAFTSCFVPFVIFGVSVDFFDFIIGYLLFCAIFFTDIPRGFMSCKCWEFDVVSDYEQVNGLKYSYLSKNDIHDNEWERSKRLYEYYKTKLNPAKDNETLEDFLVMSYGIVMPFVSVIVLPFFATKHRADVAITAFSITYSVLSVVYIFL